MSEIEVLEMIIEHIVVIQELHNSCIIKSLDELKERISVIKKDNECQK